MAAAENSQSCDSKAIKLQLQKKYDLQDQGVPYQMHRVESLEFKASLSPNQTVNVFAGSDDRDIKNDNNFDVEVYSTQITTTLDILFKAVIVNKLTCEIVEIDLIDSHYQ